MYNKIIKKIVLVFIIIFITFSMLFNTIILATTFPSVTVTNENQDISSSEHYVPYITNEYSIRMPFDYTKNNNIFFKSNEQNYCVFNIKNLNYSEFGYNDDFNAIRDDITKYDIYNDDFLKTMENYLENDMQSYIASGVIKGFSKYFDEQSLDLQYIQNNVNYTLNTSKITTFTKNKYDTFHFKGTINLFELPLYSECYMVFTKNYVTVIMTLSLDNNYFDTDEYYSIIKNITIKDTQFPSSIETHHFIDDDISILFIDLVITLFIFCIVPTIMRLSHGTYEKESAKKISLTNSIIIGILFFLISIYQETSFNIVPAIFYYYINKSILTRLNYRNVNKRKNKEKIKFVKSCNLSVKDKQIILNNIEDLSIADIKNIEIEQLQNKDKKFCPKCGKEINKNWTFCNNCGNKLK